MLHLLSLESVQWCHNERDVVSNHQPHDCLLNRLFRRRAKKISKLRYTGHLCGEFTGQNKLFPFDDVIMKKWAFQKCGFGHLGKPMQCENSVNFIQNFVKPHPLSHTRGHIWPSVAIGGEGIVVVPSVRPPAHPSVRPSVHPERRYHSIVLKISAIGLKFGGMRHSNMIQIAF